MIRLAMAPEAAAWIRGHAWTPAMRLEHQDVPGFRTTCPCQWGPTDHCRTGRHDRCHRAAPLRSAATVICRRGGMEQAHLLEPYQHRTDIYATGPRHTTAALVWLADRVCRWVCPCRCHAASPPPSPVQGALF